MGGYLLNGTRVYEIVLSWEAISFDDIELFCRAEIDGISPTTHLTE
jgi:hypothetical protein